MDFVNLVIAVIGVMLGLFGSVLSLIATWREFDRDKVKLRVSVARYIGKNHLGYIHGIDVRVVNLSAFQVVIDEVGFSINGGKERMVVPGALTSDGRSLPISLESRRGLALRFPDEVFQEGQIASIEHVYATTECGETQKIPAPKGLGDIWSK